jgi:hypothetical protein
MIGSALAASLEGDGHEIVRLVRGTPGPSEVHWDPVAAEIDVAGLEGLDAVVHLAGEGISEKRWTDEQKAKIRDSRTRGTSLLCEALASLSSPPPVLVGGSAIGIYGDKGDAEVTEQSPPGEGFLADVVVAWEASYGMAEEAGIRVAKARTGIVLSTAGGALKAQLPIFKVGLGGRLGSGRQYQSWITLDDEVSALRHLIDHDIAGPVNLTAPRPVTNAEFTDALGTALHRPTILPIPSFGPKLLYGGQLVDELLFSSARVLPAVLQDHGFHFAHPELPEALRSVLRR